MSVPELGGAGLLDADCLDLLPEQRPTKPEQAALR
jgi:hypothetical protein